jgi:hypothetical protein
LRRITSLTLLAYTTGGGKMIPAISCS